jgi:tetratricopeptide (TPR) repeat protein
MGRKFLLVLNNSEIADTESQDVSGECAWLLRIPWGFGVLLAAAALNWRGDRRLWAMAAIYALSLTAFYVVARYRFPLVPILLLLAVSMPWRPRRTAILVGAFAACLTLLPLVDARLGRSTGDYAIATALTRDPARLDEAAGFYRRALQVAPDFPGAQFGLATVLTRQGHPGDAIPFYEAAVAAWPGHEEAHYNLGYALSAVGRDDDAVHQFTEAVRLRPEDGAAHSALAQALLKLARLDDALPHLARAIELNPADATAQENLGAILANAGRILEALPHFAKAVALQPENQRYRENLENARNSILTHTPRP